MTSLKTQIAVRPLNNLNLLRLLLALLVVFSHSFPLALGKGTRGEDPDPLNQWTHLQLSFGTMAVDCFFFISGFLITASWLHSKSAVDFIFKRLLRIYPGFIVTMAFSAALVWVFCPEFRADVARPADRLYWLYRWLLDLPFLHSKSLHWSGIFAGNPAPEVANGSLWSIPIEFRCYFSVLILGLLLMTKRRFWLLLAVVPGYAIFVVRLFQGHNLYDQFFISFAAGALVWLWQDKLPFSPGIAGLCFLVLLCISQISPWFSAVFPIGGGYCLLWLAYGPRLPLSQWAGNTDLSYGTYLYAYPVQQLLATVVALRHPWMIFALATPITLLCACLSWHLVERPFLALKRKHP